MNDYLNDQANQYKALSEDYSQWLGSLLRDSEDTGKSAVLQKNMHSSAKKNADAGQSSKKKAEGKSKKTQNSGWIQVGDVLLCSSEQGEAEILFEAIEEINKKTQSLEKFRATIQQIERIGPGKNVNYIIYIKDDVPEKIVVRNKSNGQENESFSFAGDFTVQGLQN
jgi:hypothetical protein